MSDSSDFGALIGVKCDCVGCSNRTSRVVTATLWCSDKTNISDREVKRVVNVTVG